MLIKISNSPRDYAWGSRTLISDYFGLPESGQPMAEIWYGTHPSNSSKADDRDGGTLLERVGHQLPFLLKILAAAEPLSIQAHPNSAQATAGFARENGLGLPLDDAKRNYRDDRHKPEMLVALTDFDALVGFREPAQVAELFKALAGSQNPAVADLARAATERLEHAEPMRELFNWLIHLRGTIDDTLAACVDALQGLAATGRFENEAELAQSLLKSYPGDPGVLVALTMNQVHLTANDAVFLPAGVIHAYLSGLGVEIMAASDNVLRGGLTPKHIDVEELIEVLDFSAGGANLVQRREVAAGLIAYPATVNDFQLYRVEVSGDNLLADFALPGESIFLCTAGEVAISNSKDERVVLKRGEAAYTSSEAKHFTVAGSGTAFLATSSATRSAT